MKQYLHRILFATLFCSPVLVQAQITITSADMPSAGDTIRRSTTTDQWSIDPTITGTSHNWDFSFLTAQTQKFDTCHNPSSMNLAYQYYFNNPFTYPSYNSDYALRGQDLSFGAMFSMTDVQDFYVVGSSKLQHVGFGANINGIPTPVRKSPIENVYMFPLNYGDTYTSYSKFMVSLPTLGEYKQKKHNAVEVDGWGTLTLPVGTFNVLRAKFVVNITDSVYVESFGFVTENARPTEIQYMWLAPGRDLPVLQINTDSTTGAVTQIIFQDRFVPLNVKENNTVAFDVYPNPVSNILNINSDQPVERMAIYDLYGRNVYGLTPAPGQNSLSLPVNLASGTYLVEVIAGGGTARKKIVVQQ